MSKTSGAAAVLGAACMLLAQVGTAVETGQPPWAAWTQTAAIAPPQPASGGLWEIVLPPALLDAALQDLRDLRVADAQTGEEIPYIVRWDRARQLWQPVDATLYNRVNLPGQKSSATADFGRKLRKDRVNIDTAGNDFRRGVQVEGGDDAREWQALREQAHLFRGPRTDPFERSLVLLPDNDFRYLRVTVFNDQDDRSPVEIRSVRTWETVGESAPDIEWLVAPLRVTEEQQETRITFDSGAKNLKLTALRMEFAEPNFWRRVAVWGRSAEKQWNRFKREDGALIEREEEVPWRCTATDVIYRLPGDDRLDESLTVELHDVDARFLQVRIANLDDQPLTFRSASLARRRARLVFQATADRSYRVYVGAEDAKAPVYDLSRYADRLRQGGTASASLGALVSNPDSKSVEAVKPWYERHRAVLWAALFLALSVLAGMVLRLLRAADKSSGGIVRG